VRLRLPYSLRAHGAAGVWARVSLRLQVVGNKFKLV
jgi:hypothetical protein